MKLGFFSVAVLAVSGVQGILIQQQAAEPPVILDANQQWAPVLAQALGEGEGEVAVDSDVE